MAIIIGHSVSAQTSSYGELQSAYLFNFAKYIKWPGECEVFTIGVFGKSEITRELENILKGKKVRGLKIEMKEIRSLDVLSEYQIIYVPGSNSRSLSLLMAAVADKNILVVSEDDLIKKGAMISFVIEDDKLRFKLNKNRLSEAGLVASEGLLKLALL